MGASKNVMVVLWQMKTEHIRLGSNGCEMVTRAGNHHGDLKHTQTKRWMGCQLPHVSTREWNLHTS